jgi:uncharacterized protein YuzB (UPF0349 family)
MVRDFKLDAAIQDTIEIFTKVEGVQLVRLSGLTTRFQKISGLDIPSEAVRNILEKLKDAGVINYYFIMVCPHCQEISYQIVDIDVTKPKLCDTCNTLYNLIDGTTLKRS